MISFRSRALDLSELMDDPECDPVLLDRTYAHFATLNPLIARWAHVFRTWIEPHLPASLLDIGCGGGDVGRYLAGLSAGRLAVTGIDPDPRATAFARRAGGIQVLEVHSREIASASYDFVISNHVLHHLSAEDAAGLFRDSERIARRAALHNDIRRSPLGYAGFSVLGLAFPGSFIRPDGLTSIRRSYTRAELAGTVPEGWTVRTIEPFRLLAVWEAPR